MKIKDIIDQFIAGDWGEETCSNEMPCAVTCVRGADIIPISEYNFSAIPIRYINRQSYSKKCLHVGDIIIEKSGGSPTQSTGRVSFVSQELLDSVGPVVCSNFCTAFRVKKGWNPLYVYYYFQFIYNLGLFFNFEGKTSGLKNLQLDAAFAAIPIDDVSESTQNKIVAVLQGLEKKITINRRINQNLEAMAKQLYDYWFVQFDFPNEEGKPYKSSGGEMVWNDKLKREIPKNWCVLQLDKLCSFRNGINYAKDEIGEPFPIVNVRNISSSTILLDGEDFDVITVPVKKAENYILTDKDIIIARSGCPGSTRLLQDSQKTLFCGFIICCTPYDGYKRYFLTYVLKGLEGSSATTSGGSILQNVSQDTLKSLWVTVPRIDLLIRFNEIIDNLLKQMCVSLRISKELIKQRDELLPILMNGQVLVNSDLSHD